MRSQLSFALVCSLALAGLLSASTAQAQDLSCDIAVKTTTLLDGKDEAYNYPHYFTLVQLGGLGIKVASLADSKSEAWLSKKLADKFLPAATVVPKIKELKSKLQLELVIDIKYVEQSFGMDGQRQTTGYSWKGTIKGELKSADGTTLHKFDLRHFWGVNTTVERNRAQGEHFQHMAAWVLLDLLTNDKVVALIPEDQRAKNEELVAQLKKRKESLYDPSFEDEKPAEKKEEKKP